MPERGSITPDLTKRLQAVYEEKLVSLDGDQLLTVTNLPAMNRAAASNHLRRGDELGLDIAYTFLTNTENYLIRRGEKPPFSNDRLIEETGNRWDGERESELQSRDFSHKLKTGSIK